MRLFLMLSLILSSSAFASVMKTEVYKVVSVKRDVKSPYVDLTTVTGSVVYVRCDTLQFDDVARDRVAGFSSTQDCEKFLSDIEKFATPSNPVEISIGKNFELEMRVSL